MTKQTPKPQSPAARMKKPFGRSMRIDDLLGGEELSSGVGELGQAFQDAMNTDPEPAISEAPAKSVAPASTPASGHETSMPPAPGPLVQPGPADQQTQIPKDEEAMLPLSHVVENPKLQPRLRINEEHVISLSENMRDVGLNYAILVRPIEDRPGFYEIIGGNHRYRAALRLGWTQIRANIKRITFNRARIMSVDDNDSLLPRTDYEKALSYQSLLNDGIASSHREVAEQLGISKGRVTQCLSFIGLPDQVLSILNDHPDAFTYRTALDLKKVMAKNADADGNVGDIVSQALADGVMRLIDFDAPVSGLVHWVEQRLSGTKPFTATVEPRIVLDRDGRTTFKTRARDNSVVVEWGKQIPFNSAVIQDALMTVLKELAQKAESD